MGILDIKALTQSIPFRAGGSPGLSAGYNYDVLGRPVSIRLPSSGLVSYQYVGNTTYVTDPDGKIKKYTYNALGKVSKVTEQDDQGNLNLDTTYEYDALGRMTRIVQGVQTRTFTYDGLGRLISETHPESSTTTYTYDDNGNLVTKTDARGVVTVNNYDGLNRVINRSYSVGTPAASFGYDETSGSLIGGIANGRGRQTSAWTSDGIGYNCSRKPGFRSIAVDRDCGTFMIPTVQVSRSCRTFEFLDLTGKTGQCESGQCNLRGGKLTMRRDGAGKTCTPRGRRIPLVSFVGFPYHALRGMNPRTPLWNVKM